MESIQTTIPTTSDRFSGRLLSIQIDDTFIDDVQIRTPRDALNHFKKSKIRSIAGNFARMIFAFAGPLVMIILGAINFDKCPLERFIPIYLIVAGVFGLVKYLINIFENFLKKSKDHEATLNDNFCTIPSIYTVTELIMMLFAFMWLIAGSIWVFRIRPDFNEKSVLTYCNKATYLTAFITLVLSYCYLAFILFIICRYACTIFCNCRLKIVRKNPEFDQNELNDYDHMKPSVTTFEMITMDEQSI